MKTHSYAVVSEKSELHISLKEEPRPEEVKRFKELWQRQQKQERVWDEPLSDVTFTGLWLIINGIGQSTIIDQVLKAVQLIIKQVNQKIAASSEEATQG